MTLPWPKDILTSQRVFLRIERWGTASINDIADWFDVSHPWARLFLEELRREGRLLRFQLYTQEYLYCLPGNEPPRIERTK